MTLKATRFTPKILLGSPRRGNAVPNSDASIILYSSSRYDFTRHEEISWIEALDVKSGTTKVVDSNKQSKHPVWIDDQAVAVVRSTEGGETDVVISESGCFDDSSYVAGTVPSSASDLLITRLSPDAHAIAFSAPANPDGTPYNAKKADKRHTTAHLYKSLFVRHWDYYLTKQRNAIFYATLRRDSGTHGHGRFIMSHPVNALKGTGLECPTPPDGGTDCFDLSLKGLAFVSKDPDLDPALHTKRNVYFAPLRDFSATAPALHRIEIEGFEGACSSPAFSSDGRSLAFLQMPRDGAEDDKNQVFVVRDVEHLAKVTNVISSPDGKGRWDRNPDCVKWSLDGETLYLTADDQARRILFSLAYDPSGNDDPRIPQALTAEAAVADFKPLPGGHVLLSSTSIVDPCFFTQLTPRANHDSSFEARQVSSMCNNGHTYNLNPSQISSFLFQGSPTNTIPHSLVQALLIKPPDFSPKSRYPLALFVHGGPQSSWTNSWSYRWNPAVFASAGFVVVMPNITGSTGYGQAFTERIKRNWGGDPYVDLEKCLDYLEEEVDFVDTTRAVALGASYGGFMMNWINGHALGRRFKALVCHDGVFSQLYGLATDELYFMNSDFGGQYTTPSDDEAAQRAAREAWTRWDPSKHVHNWTTPTLVIHSEKDYRLGMSDGLAAFNMLRSRGVESEFLYFEDENHFVSKPENSLRWHRVVLRWVCGHAGLDVVGGVGGGGEWCEVDEDVVMDAELKSPRASSRVRRVRAEPE